jgi:uncharacterized NAD(P)/FAD-binding protein YdhS
VTAVRTVAVLGVGSRGLGVLERIGTLARGPVRVHLVDPAGGGAGVHDPAQPDYLLLNTTAGQVSMFPDAATVGAETGPPGPTLYEWATDRGLRLAADGFTTGRSGRPVRPTDYLPRRVLGEYLVWFLAEQRRRATPLDIRVHRSEAVDLAAGPHGLDVALADGTALRVDHAFLTTGHTGTSGGPYPLPGRVVDLPPGAPVGIAGFGLAAMDVMSALTVGRGGRFTAEGDGTLRYRPSGYEPELLFFSRTGLPHRARPRTWDPGPPHRPLVFTEAAIDALGRPLDFAADLLPLILDEIRVGHRRAQGHPVADRAELDRLDAAHGRFDPAQALAPRPDAAGPGAYQQWLAGAVRADLAEGWSPLRAGLDVLRTGRDTFRYAVDHGGLTPASLEDFTDRWVPAVNRAVVGPQWERHAELLALLAAGVARTPFGPAPAVTGDGGRTRVASTRLAEPYGADVAGVVRAHVPLPGVLHSASPLLAALHRRGLLRPYAPGSRRVPGADVDRDQHPIGRDGTPERRLWVLGPLCEGAVFYTNLVPSPGAFSRPVRDAHRCVAEMLAGGGGPRPARLSAGG